MLISILIPTLPERKKHLDQLLLKLNTQIMESDYYNSIEIVIDDRVDVTIGEKRNFLLEQAQGNYIEFFDDDDLPGKTYIKNSIIGALSRKDCMSLKGIMTTNGKNPEYFEHSTRYNAYRTTNKLIKYERYPNHLNLIKASIAKKFKFPLTNFGEDTDFATQIHKSGIIKTEHYCHETIYHYLYKTNK